MPGVRPAKPRLFGATFLVFERWLQGRNPEPGCAGPHDRDARSLRFLTSQSNLLLKACDLAEATAVEYFASLPRPRNRGFRPDSR